MIRVLCPRGHLIATVDIVDGAIIPRGMRHGLSFASAPAEEITRLHATCPKSRCTYDGSADYGVLCAALAAAEAAGHAKHRLTI